MIFITAILKHYFLGAKASLSSISHTVMIEEAKPKSTSVTAEIPH
jgi:hypothetical protein